MTFGQPNATDVKALDIREHWFRFARPAKDDLGAAPADVEHGGFRSGSDVQPVHAASETHSGFFGAGEDPYFNAKERMDRFAKLSRAMCIAHCAGAHDGDALDVELRYDLRIALQAVAGSADCIRRKHAR